jgi:AAA15 family ATPase/GTPase
MIKNLSIRNFKSIKKLDFKAKRVNVFIGEPNTGKSNILEALGMFSLVHNYKTGEVPIRYQKVDNLFYDNETSVDNELQVKADNYSYRLNYDKVVIAVEEDGVEREMLAFDLERKSGSSALLNVPIKFYQFKVLENYREYGDSLNPPYGSNLFNVLMNNKPLKSMVSALLKEKGYRLGLRVKDKEIEVIKEIEEVIYTYPYHSLSDPLQRIIFYWAAIETNKDSTILLEEPESHMSPFYIRDIAERIARDTNNQYLLVTHNPYFLVPLIEKTKLSDLNVFVTYLEDYQTKLKRLTRDDISELTDMDTDVFFNLDKFFAVESIC